MARPSTQRVLAFQHLPLLRDRVEPQRLKAHDDVRPRVLSAENRLRREKSLLVMRDKKVYPSNFRRVFPVS